MKTKKDFDQVLVLLATHYQGAKCGLDFEDPYQLLVATMLSAQTNDQQVNKITPALFVKYPSPAALAEAGPENLEKMIKTIGLYRNKSKHLLAAAKKLVKDFEGEIPKERNQLESLPGVGRKTANVVLSNAFGLPALAVDTHVFRVSNRLGLVQANNVLETEKQLMAGIPREKWSDAHHWLIWHGRKICQARNPKCSQCFLKDQCDYYLRGVLMDERK